MFVFVVMFLLYQIAPRKLEFSGTKNRYLAGRAGKAPPSPLSKAKGGKECFSLCFTQTMSIFWRPPGTKVLLIPPPPIYLRNNVVPVGVSFVGTPPNNVTMHPPGGIYFSQ